MIIRRVHRFSYLSYAHCSDFTKMVRAAPATAKMYEYMTDMKDKNWQMHFEKLAVDAGFPELVRL